ncbi:GGDEF domain-containing protein [Alteromonadaceae bacterium BrNp21-10]|nr:GGDEF domain-containing protein [Alteromonadaceae bacterium BrNp21-10]
MDQLSPIYDTASDGFVNVHTGSNKNLSYYQLYALMQKLTSSIDLPTLLHTYTDQVQRHLPITGITFEYAGNSNIFADCSESEHDFDLHITHGNQGKISLTYHSQRKLTSRESKLLCDLQSCLQQPLLIAVEHDQIKRLCFKDNLTGLGNRSHFDESIRRLISHSQRNNSSFGLLVLDLDHFKKANDQYGHLLGDQLLITFAGLLQDCLRDSDYAFRFGGDEFCCLLEDADELLNQKVSIRIIHAMANHGLLIKHNLTASIGSAVYLPSDSSHTLFQRADEAMYTAKQNGKNGVKCA